MDGAAGAGRGTPAAAAAAGLAAALLAGCGANGVGGGSLVRREVVVVFATSAPQTDHAAARTACADTPHASPEPLPTSTAAISTRNNVRFRVDKASDSDLARLYDCLRRQPGVVGVRPPSDG